ncbi:MAG: 23S rRNA (adenine(2503)-C(2))-methyltransferase RlmN [Ruminococcaceae bacterium]|nr:23S rRNA (adenine(2503)-C(2))-methyltransferase RlmN [Oscillospiraceae bacterium]
MNKIDIRSLSYFELEKELTDRKLPKFRTAQIYDWLHSKGVMSFEEMTNLSKDLRTKLESEFEIKTCKVLRKLVSQIDETVKYLFEFSDKSTVESVVMKYKYGYSICISTQVGCKMGCTFCASAIGGFQRNLTPSEMLCEVLTAQRDLNIKISHIVLMGTGEPLDNYDNVLKFLKLVTDEKGQNLSMRHISLSTCGLVERIYELADENLQLTLSVSLHAPNDEIRQRTMPVAKKYSIDEILKACKYYTDKTSRRISFEYAMINGVNDSEENAKELCRRLKGILCHINLIPVNEIKERDYRKSDADSLKRFISVCEDKGFAVTVRRTLGSDINASCGQLRQSVRT